MSSQGRALRKIERERLASIEYVIVTDPGCDSELHRQEVAGAMLALHESGPWSGPEEMDCGCVLTLAPFLPKRPAPRHAPD